jgi:hypothetical protein
MTDEVTRKYTTINDVLNRYASQAWRNADTAEAFPSPDSRRIRALETLILARTNLCPFGGGNVEGERAACKFGHPGCVCADVAAGKS